MNAKKKEGTLGGVSKPKGTRTKKIKSAPLVAKDLEVIVDEDIPCCPGPEDWDESKSEGKLWFEDTDVDKFNDEMQEIVEERNESLELTDEVMEEILLKQEEGEERGREVKSSTKHYDNGINVWRLIAKTENPYLQWEHTTMAMATGKTGVLVSVKEGFGNQTKIGLSYLSDCTLYLDPQTKKYHIK